MTIAIEKDWAKWRKEHPYVHHARAAMFLFHRGHAAFHASRYGAAHRNLKKWHDRISSVGQHTGPEGSNPLPGNLGGFAGAIQSAHHYVGQALPHIQALVSHPAAQTHFQSAHGHLALAAHHIGTATMLAHQLAPLLKAEPAPIPRSADDLRVWLEKDWTKWDAEHKLSIEHHVGKKAVQARLPEPPRNWEHPTLADRPGPASFYHPPTKPSATHDLWRGFAEQHPPNVGGLHTLAAAVGEAAEGKYNPSNTLHPHLTTIEMHVAKDHKGKVVGAVLHHASSNGDRHITHLMSTQQGVGTRLLSQVAAYHTEQGGKTLSLKAAEGWTPGVSEFYTKRGGKTATGTNPSNPRIQFSRKATAALANMTPIRKEEGSASEVPTTDEIQDWLEKAYEGAHTPAGEARAEPLKEYWTHGKGAAKIRWGEGGDFDRCVNELEKHMPGRAKGYCNLLHKRALGIYPATHAKLDRAGKGDVNVKKAEDVSTHKSFKAGNHTPLSISKSEDDDLADFVRYHAERALREDQ